MSAETTLQALSSILPAGTAVQQVVLESELELASGGFPSLILSCPTTREERAGAGVKKEIHQVHVQYLDRWESSSRTAAQLTTDARAALEQMKANVRGNRTLTVSGTPYALLAGDTMETEIQGPLTEKDLPFPMFAASLALEVQDLWFTG